MEDKESTSSFSVPKKAVKQREQFTYPIGGVPVQFPCKPYPTQLQMMSKIIQALNKEENALLESPTGSGKSLALLCSTLAWMKHLNSNHSTPVTDTSTPLSAQCDCKCHYQVQAGTYPSAAKDQTMRPAPGSLMGTEKHLDSVVPNLSNQPSPLLPSLVNPPTVLPQTVISGTSAGVPSKLPPVMGTNLTLLQGVPPPQIIPGIFLHQLATQSLLQLSLALQSQSQSVKPSDQQDSEFSNVLKNLQPMSLQATAHSEDLQPETFGSRALQKATPEMAQTSSNGGVSNSSIVSDVTSDSTDFKPQKKRKRQDVKKSRKRTKIEYEEEDDAVCKENPVPSKHGHPAWEMKLNHQASPLPVTGEVPVGHVPLNMPLPNYQPCHLCGCGLPPPATPRKTRKIFYGTRTHKQIKQIAHELQRTAYASVPMAILASREHTCIHPQVSRSKTKNDDCRKLLDYDEGISCKYFYKVQQQLSSQNRLREHGLNTAWDIEDLVHLGKKIQACPYFATRALLEEAEIVFCPYNYLIDPLIRQQMLVNLEGQILVLDEAHNMEDASREAASIDVTNLQLTDVREELIGLLKGIEGGRESYRMILSLVSNFVSWMEEKAESLPQTRFEEASTVWSGEDFLLPLKELGITAQSQQIIVEHLNRIFEDAHTRTDPKQREKNLLPTLSTGSINLLEGLFTMFKYLFNKNYTNDYRVSLKKSVVNKRSKQGGQWKKRKSRGSVEKVWVVTLHLWCLNPAIAFSELQVARSIILTSGTLSPMSSFASELGTSFPIQLEANHVIGQSQTWVHTLSHGPNGHPLNASYQFSETFEFQDEVGEVVLKICQTVPYGVLCFLSSYKMMEKLTSRWQDTGTWFEILKKKHIVCEPRAGDKEDFEIVMSSFYQHIEKAVEGILQHELDNSDINQDGAIFFAVCRGKVSEGLDFADENARAVITIGIPFPSVMDKQVCLKKEYNSELCRKRGLLHGNEWYEIQAYRALNQALGRCIRHRKDWGALVLVDARYGKGERYTKGLSRWVRQRVKHQSRFSDALFSLQNFVQSRMTNGDPSLEASSMNVTMNCSAAPNSPFTKQGPDCHSKAGAGEPAVTPLPLKPQSVSTPFLSPGPNPNDMTTSSPFVNSSTPIVATPNPRLLLPASSVLANSTAITVSPSSSRNSVSPLLFDSESSSPVKLKPNDTMENPMIVNDDSTNKTHPQPNTEDGSVDISDNSTLKETMELDGCAIEEATEKTLLPETESMNIASFNTHHHEGVSSLTINKHTDERAIVKDGGTDANTEQKAVEQCNDDTPPLAESTAFGEVLQDPRKATPSGPVLRRSVRTRSRQKTQADSTCVKEINEQNREEEDFKAKKKNRGRRTMCKEKKPHPLKGEGDTHRDSESSLACKCGAELMDKLRESKPASFSTLFLDSCVSGNRLIRVLGLNSTDDQCYTVPSTLLPAKHKENNNSNNIEDVNSPFHLNAIWDESIGLCYSPWECGCGQITGVRVHCSSFYNNLIGMVILRKSTCMYGSTQ